jgi:hypothetical protein
MMINQQPQEYPDAESMRLDHEAISQVAERAAETERPYGTVVYKHLVRIAQTHRAIAYALEKIILAYFIARAQEGDQ